MKERGFTIIELVITTALLSSALLVFAMIFVSITRLQVKTAASRSAQETGRYVLEQMARDIRSSAAISSSGSDCLVITADNQTGGGKIAYQYDGSTTMIWRNTSSGVCTMSSPAVRMADSNSRVLRSGGLPIYNLLLSSAGKPSVSIHFTVKQADASLDTFAVPDPYAYTYNIDTLITPREQ